MHIRHILFDLDGTLLPMNQDEFVTFYMPLLAKKYISEGISFDPKAFIASVWKGYGAMVNNDGSCTNREAFWQYMDELLPTDSENSERIALDFYANEFNQAIAVTQPNSLSDKVVKKAKEKGIRTYLATNPLTSRDVVRHPLVQRIVKAYEEYEQKQEQKKSHTRDRKKRGTR